MLLLADCEMPTCCQHGCWRPRRELGVGELPCPAVLDELTCAITPAESTIKHATPANSLNFRIVTPLLSLQTRSPRKVVSSIRFEYSFAAESPWQISGTRRYKRVEPLHCSADRTVIQGGAVHGKFVTFGVTRGCMAVASPLSSITWLISP